ncbi:MAG: hypothetical protein CMP56_01170 [Flavobacteriales bacterium]|nr:hypothetical protein [Flavobacteriales bacterium]|tara:strand:+ start:879 stop:1277 length:399 start_codon:yes stop_codon:yes gene_type:complete
MHSKLILFYFLIPIVLFSQESNIIHYQNSQIKELINNYQIGQKNKSIKVYRIQLDSSISEEKITKTKKRCLALLPNKFIYEKYEQPEFKLVTSAYLDKKNAEKELKKIKQNFKQSFIFEETISIDVLKEELN